MTQERLQKLMARAGYGSRRSNEALIRAGRVQLNGQTARLGDKADPTQDVVLVDGRKLRLLAPTYIMLHKPKGILSSTEDELQQNRQTVRDLVDLTGHLYPVGRLDKQSTGLILLTNDGALAHRLTHPRFQHEKVYNVVVAGDPSSEVLEKWAAGLDLDGKQTAPAEVKKIGGGPHSAQLKIVLREGRKRQIRRVAALLGFPVLALERTQIGPLKLTLVDPGAWRHLTVSEVNALRAATGLN